jgi:hypothetical protein
MASFLIRMPAAVCLPSESLMLLETADEELIAGLRRQDPAKTR